MGFDIFSLDAANHAQDAANHAQDAANHAQSANNKADTNLNASIALLQMVSEMRDWQTGRFNDLVAGINRRADENKVLLEKINELQGQVAALQKRLYDEEKSKTHLKAVVR